MKGCEKIIYDIIQSQDGYIGPLKHLAELSGYSVKQISRVLHKLNLKETSQGPVDKMSEKTDKMSEKSDKMSADREFDLRVQKELEEIGELDVEAIMEAYRNR